MENKLEFLNDDLCLPNINYSHNNANLLKTYKTNGSSNVKDEIVLSNLKLVHKIASMYSRTTKMEFEDLVQEGLLGLILAIEKFDISMNTKFSTYAYYWIRQHIDRAISNNGNLIRIPSGIFQDVKKLRRYEKDQLNSIGHIDVKSLCCEMNISTEKYYELKKYAVNYLQYASLNCFIDVENGENELIDYINTNNVINYDENNENYDTENMVIKSYLKNDIDSILSSLSPREEKIIKLRYGIDDGNFRSLQEIGNELGLSRERIRKIESKAISKLKYYERSRKVKDYYYN